MKQWPSSLLPVWLPVYPPPSIQPLPLDHVTSRKTRETAGPPSSARRCGCPGPVLRPLCSPSDDSRDERAKGALPHITEWEEGCWKGHIGFPFTVHLGIWKPLSLPSALPGSAPSKPPGSHITRSLPPRGPDGLDDSLAEGKQSTQSMSSRAHCLSYSSSPNTWQRGVVELI